MNKHEKKTLRRPTNYELYRDKILKDPKARKLYDEYGKQLEIAYKILQLRKKQGMSQNELAKKVGTTQSNVARIEAGQQNFTMATLQKIAKVFKHDLQVEFVYGLFE